MMIKVNEKILQDSNTLTEDQKDQDFRKNAIKITDFIKRMG